MAEPLSSLDDVFSSSDPQPANASAGDQKTKEEPKDEGDQKFPVASSSEEGDSKDEKSSKPAKKSEAKKADDDEPADEENEDNEKSAKDADEESEDSDASTEEDGKPSDKQAKDKWDSEENPYLKRFKDTSANWNKEHQEKIQLQNHLAQLQREMATLRKIADGTYDPEKDDPAKQVTHEDVATKALNVGKTLASRNAAIAQFGLEEVNSRLNEFNTIFEGHEMINNLVLNAEAPVYEAFRILDRFKFEQKYGSSPADWHKSIRAEAEKELREKIKKEVTEELMGRVDKKNNTPRGLSSSRGSNGLKSGQNSKGKGPTPLGEIF